MPPARKRAVSACCEAAERPETVASQPASCSHRTRPLEVAISIVDGTDKYQWTEHALTNLLIWCADHAPKWPVACTGPLRATWPGHTERWS